MTKNKKLFIIGIALFTLVSFVCGCNKDKNTSKSQLYYAICNPNVQGVKEALKNNPELVKETIKTSSKTKPLELAVREIESGKIWIK